MTVRNGGWASGDGTDGWKTLIVTIKVKGHIPCDEFISCLESHWRLVEATRTGSLLDMIVWPPVVPANKFDAAASLESYQGSCGMIGWEMIGRYWEVSLAKGWVPAEIVTLWKKWPDW